MQIMYICQLINRVINIIIGFLRIVICFSLIFKLNIVYKIKKIISRHIIDLEQFLILFSLRTNLFLYRVCIFILLLRYKLIKKSSRFIVSRRLFNIFFQKIKIRQLVILHKFQNVCKRI